MDSDNDGYVEIDSAAKLWWFSHEVNNGNRSLNAELTANIDLSGTCGEGIGNWMPISHEEGYTGNFNGQGFTVSNLYIASDEQYAGLFGYVKGATIENVTVTGSVSSTFSFIYYPDTYESFEGAAGGVVAYLDGGTIRNCHVDMTVSGGSIIGGICGKLVSDGLIENCTTLGSAAQGGENVNNIGGIVGNFWSGTVRGCTNAATVGNILETATYAGGIAGTGYGIIENCLNFGNVEIAGTYGGHGGITGNQVFDSIVRNCGNHGTVSGYCTGGIVGDNCGIIENCYNVGSVSGTSENVTPIAYSRDGGTATNCYYLSDTTTEDGGRTAEQFASGQVAYELNGSTTTDESVWKQTLGTDTYPALTGDNVYYVTSQKCDGTDVKNIYSNSSEDIIEHADTDSDGDAIYDTCRGFTFAGAGTESDPYIVTTIQELNAAVNSTANATNYVKLGRSIVPGASYGAVLVDAKTTPFVLNLAEYHITSDGIFQISTKGTITGGNEKSILMWIVAISENANVLIKDVQRTSNLTAQNGALLTLTDCTNIGVLRTKGEGSKIVADNVTTDGYSNNGFAQIDDGGTLVLDGVTHTESITELHYPYAHIDADGDCRCDVGNERYHNGTASVFESNDNGTHNIHWSCCDFIDVSNVACATSNADGDCTTSETCLCGYVLVEAKESHTFNVPDKDGTHHWNKCFDCDAIDMKVPHSGTDDGNCKTPVTCSCGHVITVAKNDHSFDNACDPDCNNPGCEFTRTTEHSPEADDHDCTTDILCSICDAVTTKGKEAHTGGTATCTAKAVCTDCGTAYGSTLAHTPETDDGNCMTAVKCSVCQTVTTPANAAHTGGTATCQAQANCSECGTAYGELGSHSFTVAGSDKNQHWNKCLYCEATDTKADHTGGTATCTVQAVCTVCNTSYGSTLAHNYTVVQKDETHHWNKCSDCAAIDTKEAHNGTATCTTKAHCSVCDTDHGDLDANNHSETTFVYTVNADSTTHTKKYVCCGVVALDSEAHTYGADNTCVCGAEKPIPTYTVTVENGTASDGKASVVVNENGAVTVTANAAPEGKKFKGWSVNGTVVSTEQSYTFNATADTTITAVYEDIPKDSGCGSVIGIGSSVIVVALIGLAVFFIRKKKA